MLEKKIELPHLNPGNCGMRMKKKNPDYLNDERRFEIQRPVVDVSSILRLLEDGCVVVDVFDADGDSNRRRFTSAIHSSARQRIEILQLVIQARFASARTDVEVAAGFVHDELLRSETVDGVANLTEGPAVIVLRLEPRYQRPGHRVLSHLRSTNQSPSSFIR